MGVGALVISTPLETPSPVYTNVGPARTDEVPKRPVVAGRVRPREKKTLRTLSARTPVIPSTQHRRCLFAASRTPGSVPTSLAPQSPTAYRVPIPDRPGRMGAGSCGASGRERGRALHFRAPGPYRLSHAVIAPRQRTGRERDPASCLFQASGARCLPWSSQARRGDWVGRGEVGRFRDDPRRGQRAQETTAPRRRRRRALGRCGCGSSTSGPQTAAPKRWVVTPSSGDIGPTLRGEPSSPAVPGGPAL